MCRLAYNQGILQGDLNDLQQLALLAVKGWDDKKALDAEWRNFKYMAIAAHPENTKMLLETLDSVPEEELDQWAEPITDEDLAEYVPFSEYADEIIADLRNQGFAVRD